MRFFVYLMTNLWALNNYSIDNKIVSGEKRKNIIYFNSPIFSMQTFQPSLSPQSSSKQSQYSQKNESDFNFSQQRLSKCQSIRTFDRGRKQGDVSRVGVLKCKKQGNENSDKSFYSQSQQIKLEESLEEGLIFEKKVEKKDIVFRSRQFKESFIKYFTEVIYGFLKQPSDLTFSIALYRLKYYTEQSPFLQRSSKTESDTTDKQDQSFNSNDSERQKKAFSNSKTTQSLDDSKSDLSEVVNVESLLRSMFYQNQHQFMIYSFDYAFCHLTFLAAMLYFWSKLDQSTSGQQNLAFVRNFYISQRGSEKELKSEKTTDYRNNIFKTFKFYITQRSQSLNISHVNILIVYFFLAHLKTEFFFQNINKDISEIQQNFINNLKLYRRIKKMEKEFNSTQNRVVFESQLHKYEYENKLIESMEKTFLIFQILNTHNFVSSPLQKYYDLYEFENSKKLYHLKRDNFCIWILGIILRLCEKRSADSISKSAYYIITFLGILRKFKQEMNFEGISMVLPILYNIREQLPKVWAHAVNRRRQIDQKLRQYSQLLRQKMFKKQDIAQECSAIISQDVIYQMCLKFQKYAKIDKNESPSYVSLERHKKFYEQFLVHIIYHRDQTMQKYIHEIEDYNKEKQIGITFNIYLLDTYVCKSSRATNTKALWNALTQRAKHINQEINYNFYIDIIDYWFLGSTLKYKQIDI